MNLKPRHLKVLQALKTGPVTINDLNKISMERTRRELMKYGLISRTVVANQLALKLKSAEIDKK